MRSRRKRRRRTKRGRGFKPPMSVTCRIEEIGVKKGSIRVGRITEIYDRTVTVKGLHGRTCTEGLESRT